MNMELNDTAAHTGSCVAAMVRAFRFNNVNIRTFEYESGDLWFAAQDVCDVLGEGSLGAALDRLEESEKRIVISSVGPGYEAVAVVKEAGLRSMIGASSHPQADTFLEWVGLTINPVMRARKPAAYILPAA